MKAWIFVVLGFALKFVSKQVELLGDAQPAMAADASSGRLGYHLVAMVLLVAAIGCFIAAIVSFIRNRTA